VRRRVTAHVSQCDREQCTGRKQRLVVQLEHGAAAETAELVWLVFALKSVSHEDKDSASAGTRNKKKREKQNKKKTKTQKCKN